jgi:uncharacterized protein (DUF488 family)
MTKVFTIGFSKKTAEEFFGLIHKNQIVLLIDVRLNNTSQLSGFSKKNDLKFFLKRICECDYLHIPELAPTKTILDNYKKKMISWEEYEIEFNKLLKQRGIPKKLKNVDLDYTCFLCSEESAKKCHRRLVVEFLKTFDNSITIVHI